MRIAVVFESMYGATHEVADAIAAGPRRGVRLGQQRLGDAERAEHLQGARVHDERPRGPERLGTPLHHPDPCAMGHGLRAQG
jgi:hypothetical protein